jgi:hypothetical protein
VVPDPCRTLSNYTIRLLLFSSDSSRYAVAFLCALVCVGSAADQVLTEVLELWSQKNAQPLVWQCENQHEHRLTIEMSNEARFKLRLEFDFCVRKKATVLTAAS